MKMDVKVQLWNNGMELLNKLNFDYSITTIEQECVLHFHEHGIPSFKKIWKCFVTKDQGVTPLAKTWG
jgi:hypothetical protein